MITPGYAITATERVLPRLALDFTTASLDSRVTVTRALNTATRINSNGYIEGVNANLPRFDFDPTGTGVCKGLLIEESRVNLLPYSETFGDASWTTFDASVSGTAVSAPNNTLTAYALVENSASSNHGVFKQFGTYGAGTYTFSVFVKANGRTQFRLAQTVTATYSVDFDLSAVTAITSDGGATGTIQAFRDGYYRCTMTFTTVASINMAFVIYIMSAGATSYQGNGTSGIIPWGGQVEAGAFATSYIPTTTTSVTRNADTVSMTGTNFSSWYNASEGAFEVIGSMNFASPSIFQMFMMLGDANNSIQIFNNLSASRFRGDIYSGGAIQKAFTYTAAGAPASNTLYNILLGYKVNDFGMAVNGNTVATANAGSVPVAPSALYIGCTDTGFQQLGGHIQKINFFPQKLIGAEIQAFSK